MLAVIRKLSQSRNVAILNLGLVPGWTAVSTPMVLLPHTPIPANGMGRREYPLIRGGLQMPLRACFPKPLKAHDA